MEGRILRTADGYRFGLQFKTLSDAHRQVGEFLESLGNKKSDAVITALTEYINTHPEVLNRDNPIKQITVFGYSEETLNSKLEKLIKKHIGSEQLFSNEAESDNRTDNGTNQAMSILLAGLESFG